MYFTTPTFFNIYIKNVGVARGQGQLAEYWPLPKLPIYWQLLTDTRECGLGGDVLYNAVY